jgi:hypothetical protein
VSKFSKRIIFSIVALKFEILSKASILALGQNLRHPIWSAARAGTILTLIFFISFVFIHDPILLKVHSFLENILSHFITNKSNFKAPCFLDALIE